MSFLKKFFNSEKNLATKMGAFCTLLSILLSCTLFIPIITITFIAFLVEILVSMFGNQREGMMALLFLTVIFITALLIAFTGVRNLAKKGLRITKKEIFLMMFIFYWIIHPLGFYIYWAVFTNFSNDGQIILGAIFSFPFSSLAFVAIGFLIDMVIKKYTPVNGSIK